MSREPTALHGLRRSIRHPGRSWQLDFDYLHKLGPAELDWLARFSNESYHSARWQPDESLHDQEQLRERWRAYKANERDALTRAQVINATCGFGDHDRDECQRAAFEGLVATAVRGHDYLQPGVAEDAMLDALEVRRALAEKASRRR